jgi:HEAT repeat protein
LDKCIDIGSPAVKPLIEALNGDNAELRTAVESALGKIDWQTGNEELRAWYLVLRHKWDECVKMGALAVQPLAAIIRNGAEPSSVREGAADALAKITDAEAIEPLLAALGDRERQVRLAAARALVGIGRSGKINDRHKQLILSQRNKIVTEYHVDQKTSHEDVRGPSHRDSDNIVGGGSHTDEMDYRHSDLPARHTDVGIGVDFPL